VPAEREQNKNLWYNPTMECGPSKKSKCAKKLYPHLRDDEIAWKEYQDPCKKCRGDIQELIGEFKKEKRADIAEDLLLRVRAKIRAMQEKRETPPQDIYNQSHLFVDWD
jgi:hypothetical protein